jgi:hypothetical protein
VDEALAGLPARDRAAEIDESYARYDRDPLNVADAWGDLASFRSAAGHVGLSSCCADTPRSPGSVAP